MWLAEDYSPAPEIVDSGEGFWIVNNSGVDNTIVLTGDVVTNLMISTPVDEGLNLLAYPFSADRAVSNITFASTNGQPAGGQTLSEADQIWTWDPDGTQYVKQFYGGDGLGVGFDDVWLFEDYSPSDTVIEAGEGFWYVRKTGEGDYAWEENRPYDPNAP